MRLVRQSLFLFVFAWHVWVVNPRCVFYAQNDLFLCNWPFFRDFLMTPGGLIAWSGGLLLQACGAGWPGVLALTAVAGLLCAATSAFLRRLVPQGAELAWAVPALVLLVAHGRYEYPLSVSLGAALAMGAAVGYQRLSSHWPRWRLAWFAGLCLLLFYAAGVAGYVFAACSLIFEFYGPGNRWTKAGLVVCAAAARCAVGGLCGMFHPGTFYFHIPAPGFFATERALSAYAVALYASFPLCALWLADRAARRQRSDAAPQPGGSRAVLRGSVATVAFLGVALLTGYLSVERGERTVLMLHDGAERQAWQEVLELGREVPAKRYSQYVIHDVNQALYHTGRLPWDMFTYRQLASPFVVLSALDPYTLGQRRLADFYFRLGRVNHAEFLVHEGFILRPHAENLRLRAKVAVVKRQIPLARVLLAVLRDDVTSGSWADEYLRRLEEDPTFSADEEVADIRSRMLIEEDIHQTAVVIPASILAVVSVNSTDEVASLLRQRPKNRMAFEYLMAIHLVNRDVKSAVQLLPWAAELGYSGTPSLYEEAAMLCVRRGWAKPEASGPAARVHGCPISRETLDRIRKLDSLTQGGHATPREISRAAGELGLSYFCYYYQREE